MTAHESEYNGAEVDAKGDIEKVDVTAGKERGENDGDRVGGSFVDLHVNSEIIASSLEENGAQKPNVGSIMGEEVVRDHVATEGSEVEVRVEHGSENVPVHVEGDDEKLQNQVAETTSSVVDENEKNYEDGAKNGELLLEEQCEETKEECHEEMMKGDLDENGGAITTDDRDDDKRIISDSIVELGENKEDETKFAVGVEGEKQDPEKETGHEIEVELIVEVTQQPESVVVHQVEMKSVDELEYGWLQDNISSETGQESGAEPVRLEYFTSVEKIIDQAGAAEQVIVVEANPEPCTISSESKKHEESGSVAIHNHIEEKHELQTLEANIGDQGRLNSSVVGQAIVIEGKPEPCSMFASPERHGNSEPGAIHIEEKQESCALESKIEQKQGSDSSVVEGATVVEGKSEPCLFATPEKHGELEPRVVHIEEKHESCTLETENEEQEGLDSSVAGGIVVEEKPEPCTIFSNPEKHEESEPNFVHVEEKHELCTMETEVGEQEGLDSSVVQGEIVVEGKPNPCSLFADPEKHEESKPGAIHVQEKHGSCTLEKEIGEQEGLDSSIVGGAILVEGKPEVCTLFASLENHEEPGAVHIEEKREPSTLETEIREQDRSGSFAVGGPMVVEEKPDPSRTSTMSAKPEKREEPERVALHIEDKHEPQTLETETGDHGELDSSVEVESKQESENTGMTVDQERLQTASEVVEMQQPEPAVLEAPQSDPVPVRQEESMFMDVVNDVTPDECFDEYATDAEVKMRNNQHTGEDSEPSDSYGASSITSTNEDVNCGHPMETAEVDTLADHVKDLHVGNDVSIGPLEISSTLNASQINQEELVKEVAENVDDMEVLEFSNKCTGSCEGLLQPDSEAPYTVGESSEDLNSDIVSASSVEVEIGCTSIVETASNGAHSDTEGEIPDYENNDETNIGYVCHNTPAVNLESMFHNGFLQFGKFAVTDIECGELINKDDDKKQLLHQEAEAIGDIHSVSDYLNASTLDEDMIGTQFSRRQPCYIIKVPRFNNDDLWTSTQQALSELDEKTLSRDSVLVAVQKEKVVCGGYRKKLEAAKTDERAIRATYNAKRQDLSSVQSIINKLNKATSIEEIDEMIDMKDHSLQHETMSLKQEKLYIQEIKELKAQRKQLSSTVGSKAEIEETFGQREQIYECHRTLKKELDIIGSKLKQAEEKTNVAQKNYDDEQKVLKDLQEQFRSVNEVRQEAFVHWCNLKNESIGKSKYFFSYKNDQEAAANYISLGNRKGLWLHCNRQVERMMKIWNKNEEFRKQYVESNKNSTLRRLGTMDGRSLGLDEDPPVLNINRKSFSPLPQLVINPHKATIASVVKPDIVGLLPPPTDKDIFPILQATQTSQPAKSRKSANSTVKETITLKVSDREEIDEAGKEETNKEEEPVRKEEELVREEELGKEKSAAKKEQFRLEQRAKAKEAEERKKKKAERAQERAEYKARKEAELRDKKRAKKEKRKAVATMDSSNGGDWSDSAPTDNSTPEIALDSDVPVATASKRPSRRARAVKQHNRIQPVPLPLRNRSKRKIRSWMWAVLIILMVFALFLVGNHFSSLSFSRTHFGI